MTRCAWIRWKPGISGLSTGCWSSSIAPARLRRTGIGSRSPRLIDLRGVDPDIILLLNMMSKALVEIEQGAENPREIAYDALVCGNVLLNGIDEAWEE